MEYYDKKDYLDSEDAYINHVIFSKALKNHAHDFIEIAYIESGSGIHHIGGQEISIKAGDVFVINYDVPHSYTPDPDSTLSIYNCLFTPILFGYSMARSRNFTDITNHFLFKSFQIENLTNFWKLSSIDVGELFFEMYKEFTDKDYGYIQMIRAYLIELLMIIFRSNRSERQNVSFEQNQFDKALEYINKNYSQDITLDELAALAFVSPAYFSRQFKIVTGHTFKEYLQGLRVDRACHLLKNSSRKILDIANEVGYQDLKYFNEIFKRKTLMTPSKFRKEG